MAEAKLHIGQLLDMPAVDVDLRGKGLKAHTLIVGQSGSGKSFMLGRFLEEIAAKTSARIVILDPNSDFVKFSEINEEARRDFEDGFSPSDTAKAFRAAWNKVPFDVLTKREATDLDLHHPKAAVEKPTLSWPKAAMSAADMIGFDPKTEAEEIYVLNRVFKAFPEDAIISFDEFFEAVEKLWEESEGADTAIALRVYVRIVEMRGLTVWATGKGAGSVGVRMRALFDDNAPRRVVCIDLASLDRPEQRSIVANMALDALWVAARTAWLKAIKLKRDEDDRRPVFVVIDEAHNLAPTGQSVGREAAVKEMLTRIATEGRKYGIYLVMVTQRPSRLDETIRSQCDNLCLLKMNDRHDLDLIEKSFGFIPPGGAQRALQFQQGDMLLAGGLAQGAQYVKVAPRRTQEGGRNLQDSVWLGT
jgi:DNA helicase HerA-like ATPase